MAGVDSGILIWADGPSVEAFGVAISSVESFVEGITGVSVLRALLGDEASISLEDSPKGRGRLTLRSWGAVKEVGPFWEEDWEVGVEVLGRVF